MERLIIPMLALTIDLALGEPYAAIHPVVWMGKVISILTKGSSRHSHKVQFFWGMGVVFATVALFTVPVFYLLAYLKSLNLIAYIIVSAFILKASFSLKELSRTALKIKGLLASDKLSDARFELRALVGRDTRELNTGLMVSATVESVAENICDSFVAPLFYFLVFGVTGAVAYRAMNTLDAMIGHHGEFEYLGKFAAKLDTIANYVPARIAALAIVLATRLTRNNVPAAWRIMLRDHRNTASPNAGWTMGAIAGALGVQLEKVGFYRLGDNHNPLSLSTIDTALQIVMTAALVWYLIVISLAGVNFYAPP